MLQHPARLSLFWHMRLECWQGCSKGTMSCDFLSERCCACSTAGKAPGTYVNSEKDAQADVGELRCELGLYDNTNNILNHGNCTANPADCGTLGKVGQLSTPSCAGTQAVSHGLDACWIRTCCNVTLHAHFNVLYPDVSKPTGGSESHKLVLKDLTLPLIF